MAKYSSTIEYNLSTKLDSKGIDSLRKKLNDVQTQLFRLKDVTGAINNSSSASKKYTSVYEQDYQTILKIQKALSSSTNFMTGNLNTKQFTAELSKMEISAEQLVSTFKNAGAVGQQAFNSLAASLASTETRVSKMSTTVAKLFNTFQNTVRWGITASIFETASNSIGRAVEYVKDLDKSLNDIRIVSGYSSEEMTKFADSANKAAQALGQTTTAYTNASLIYIQQGKSLKESNDLAELTLKTANVTGQATSEVSEQLTSLMNGYQIAVDDMEASVDKLAKVAAVGASDLEELATAESKVASTANALGVSQDQLVAQLSTIISVTRQAPENVGNAMKTIYARLGDLQLGETLEDGTSLGTIGKALDAVGINIQTTTGDLRDMGDVLEELMGVWDNLDTGEKQALAIKLAGKYQYNNLMALLENSKMYKEQLEASENSLGTINEQEQVYLDSLEAKMNSMQTAFEGFINSIFNPDDIKPFIDDVTDLINLLTGFSSNIGGGSTFLAGIFGTGARMFSSNIGDQALNIYQNKQVKKRQQDDAILGQMFLRQAGVESSSLAKDSATYKAAITLGSRTNTMNSSQQEQAKKLLSDLAKTENESIQKGQEFQRVLDQIAIAYQKVTGEAIDLNLQSDGQVKNLDNALARMGEMKNEYKDIQKTLGTMVKEGRTKLGQMTNDIIKYTSDGKRITKASGREFLNQYSERNDALQDLIRNSGFGNIIMESDAYKKYGTSVTKMMQYEKELNSKGTGSNKISTSKEVLAAADETIVAIDELLRYLTELGEKFPETKEAVEKFREEVNNSRQATEGFAEVTEDLSKALDFKKLSKNAISFAGSIGQLAAGLSAIKSMGSIWAESDVSIGDKLLSTLENLGFTIPMIVSAYGELKTSSREMQKALKMETAEQAQATSAKIASEIASSKLAKSEKLVGIATAVATKAASGLNIILGKAPQIAAIFMAISGVIGLVQGIAQQADEDYSEKLAENIEKAQQALSDTESIQQAKDSVNDLNETYLNTGEGLEDVQNAVKNLADALGASISEDDLKRESLQKTIDKLYEYKDAQDKIAQTSVSTGLFSILNNPDLVKRSDSFSQEYLSYGDPLSDVFGAARGAVLGDDSFLDFENLDPSLQSYIDNYWGILTTGLSDSDKAKNVADVLSTELMNAIIHSDSTHVLSNGGFVQGATANQIIDDWDVAEEMFGRAREAVKKFAEQKKIEGNALTDEQEASLYQGINDAEAELLSYVSEDTLEQIKTLTAQKASFAVQDIVNQKVKAGITDPQEIVNEALKDESVQEYAGMVDEDVLYDWLKTLITTYLDVSGEEAENLLSSSSSSLGLVTPSMKARYGVLQMMYGDEADEMSLTDYSSRAAEQDSNGNFKGNEVEDYYSSLRAQGVSDSVLADLGDKITKEQIDYLASSSAVQGGFVSLNDILSDVASGVQNEYTKAIEHASVVSSEDEARKIFEKEVDKALDSASDSAVLDGIVDAFVGRAQQQAAQTGSYLSDDDAFKQVQDELSVVLNSTLSDADKTHVLVKYFNGDIEDLSAAVSEKAIQFQSIAGLSAESNTFVQGRYTSAVSGLTSNEAYMSSYNELQGTVFDQANDFVSAVYTGLTDEMVSQISEISTRDDFNAIEHSVDSLVDLGYSASDAWGYALEHIEDAAQGLDVEDFQNYQELKGVVGAGRSEYYRASQGYVSGDAVKEDFTNAMAYAAELNLSTDQLKSINWNQSWDKIQQDMAEMATGFDMSRDTVNDFRQNLADNLSEFNLTSDDAKAYVDELSQYDDDTIAQLEALNLLKEENLGALLQILDAADGNGERLIGLATQWSQEQDGSYAGLQAADRFNGTGLKKVGKFADSDNNSFADSTDDLWEYASELGYTAEQFSALVQRANEAGLSTEEFKQQLENLTYGLDSISDKAQDAANALVNAGLSNEQKPVYDEFGNATGSYTSDVQDTISGWGSWMTDQLSSVGMFNKENASLLSDFLKLSPDIQFTATAYLDDSKLEEQIAELNLDPPDFFLRAQIVDVQDAVESVQSSIANGEDIDSDALEKIYNIAPELKEISLASKEGEQALKGLNTQLQQMEIQTLADERSKIVDQIQDIEQELSDHDRVKIGVDVDKEQAIKDLNNLNKQLDKINTEIDIKINSNVDQIFDDMQDMEDEIESVKNAFSDGDGIIDSATYHQALKYFGDLTEYTTEYGNNQLKVTAEGQQAWIAAAEAKQQATIEEKRNELQVEADYYGAQADAYEAAAAQYDQMAQAQLTTDEEVSSTKASIDQDLTNALADNDQVLADSSASISTSEMQNSSDVANQANQDNALMVSNTQSALTSQAQMYSQWANSAIANANQVAQAMSNAAAGKTSSTGASAGTIGSSYAGKSSTSGTTSNSSEKKQSSSGSDWTLKNYKANAATEATNLRGQAEAAREAQNRLLGEIQGLEVLTLPGSNKIGGSGSGGSGSGGGGSEYEPKTKDELEDEADRYEKVNAQIDKLNNALEQLNTEEARLVGFNRVDIIKEETANIKKQIEVYQEKLKLQKEERDEVKKSLTDYGVTFDNDGYIANYQEKFNECLNGINYLIGQYNAATTEEAQDALEEQIESAQNAFDQYKDLIEKYDELNSNSIKETEKSIQDLHDKIEDMIIDLFNDAVDATDKLKDMNNKWLDLQKALRPWSTEEGDPFLAAELASKKIAGYLDADTESANKFYDTMIKRYTELRDKAKTEEEKAGYQKLLDRAIAGKASQGKGSLEENGSGYLDMVFDNARIMDENMKQYEQTGKSDLFGEDQEALLKASETVYNQAVEAVTGLREEIDGLRDDIIDCIDDVADKVEERNDLWTRINDQLDHYMSLSQMIHGDSIKGYEEQEKILELQIKTNQQQLAEAKAEAEYWDNLKGTLKEGSKEWKEADSKAAEAVTKQNELLQTSIETAQKLLQAQANKAVAQWEQNLFGTDMDWVQTEWEMANRNQDYYLDAVNKAYNIQKLQSQYNDLLDGAVTLDVQKKISDQMNQQLTYLREKANLSAYDVSYAQAQLEILKQQIALEEAQANKSQMKLRRDSQGNYNYVYTADEDNVKDAQDSLLDAKNNAYNLAKDQMKQTQEDSFSAIQQAKQTILDIWTDTALTTEQRADRIKEVTDNLKEYLEMTGEQLSTSNMDIVNSFYDMVDSLNDENKGNLQTVYDDMKAGALDAFEQVDDRWSTTISNAIKNTEKFDQATVDLTNKMKESFDEYDKSVQQASVNSGENLDDITDNLGAVGDAVDSLTDSFDRFSTGLKENMEQIAGYADALAKYQEQYDKVANENSQLLQTIEDLKKERDGLLRQVQQGANEGSVVSTTTTSGSSSGSGDNGGSGNQSNGYNNSGYSESDLISGIAQAIYNYGWDSGWGNNPVRSTKLTQAYGAEFAKKVQDYINKYFYDDSKLHYDPSSNRFSSYNLIGYDTGGYTGDWSDGSGKLALLHAKEIVLNASDTENILKAVESVRAMTEAMKGVSLAEAVGSISSIGRSIETQNGTVDQNVSITAEFPNATSADEIREAILGLNNQVMHYTHRKA